MYAMLYHGNQNPPTKLPVARAKERTVNIKSQRSATEVGAELSLAAPDLVQTVNILILTRLKAAGTSRKKKRLHNRTL